MGIGSSAGATSSTMIGHNRGPELAGGSWRRHCWTEARRSLLPTLPIEVLRTRVRRARELGLDYRSYASIRAASGHDVIAFLFSSNALRLMPATPALPPDRADKLIALVDCGRLGLSQGQLAPAAMLAAAAGGLDAAAPAPAAFAPWPAIRERLKEALAQAPGRLSPGEVVLVGDAPWEGEWCAAGRLAGYLPADQYFVVPA
ncbi:hypothetical protein [Halodurantibacterium flavum]|uniref:Uncharacterized protein n=1 Tax=Halodurantibacterium flavum TaxID=1382802 RepID=A0ABW4S5S7_9RHOB